jgi:leader peptidase (prepilin peptidase)/N-methyltransferase
LTSFSSWVWPVLLAPFIGSFLGVIVTRADTPRGIVFGRSVCASCGVGITARDLIPVTSWLILRGRCRGCAQPIGLFQPLIELAALAIALWSASLFSGALLWVTCSFGWVLLALAATDLKYYLLPDFLTLPLIPAGLLVAWIFNPQALLSNTIGLAVGYGFVIALRYLYWRLRGREGMGLGDAKLLAGCGAWVAWGGLPSVILVGALTGLAFALLDRMRGGTISLTNRVPFGTFLCLGTWIVWLYGPLTAG